MAYVPPHRRNGGPRTPLVPPDTRPSGREQLNKRPPNAPVPEAKEEYTTEEIQNHYWDLRRAGMTGEEQPTPRYSTLNDAKHKEGALTHVMMFHRAQQRWDDESVILAKFNLHILPGYYQCKAQRAAEKVTGNWNNAPSLKASTTSSSVPLVDGIHQSSDERVDEKVSDEIKGKLEDERNEITSETNENVGETDSGDDANTQRKSPLINEIPELEIIPTNTTPVAFFAQWPGPMESEDFRFCGYYHVKYIALLAPYSQALARMLEQKRNLFNGWDKALTMQHPERMKGIDCEWAVIKFAKLEGENAPPPPSIVRLPPQERKRSVGNTPKKTVKELLAEMRSEDDATGTAGTRTGSSEEHRTNPSSEAPSES